MRRLSLFLLSVLLLTACGYGNALPPTATMSPFGNGKDTKIGELLVQDITVVTNLDTTFSGLSLSVINNTLDKDQLISAIIGDTELALTSDDLNVTTLLVKPRATLRLGHASNLKAIGQPNVSIGSYVNVGLVFEKAGIVETRALVVTNTGMYSDVSLPAPLVTPSAKPDDHGAAD